MSGVLSSAKESTLFPCSHLTLHGDYFTVYRFSPLPDSGWGSCLLDFFPIHYEWKTAIPPGIPCVVSLLVSS